MWSLALLAYMYQVGPMNLDPWIKAQGGGALVDVEDGAGVALASDDGNLYVFENGSGTGRKIRLSDRSTRVAGFSSKGGVRRLVDNPVKQEDLAGHVNSALNFNAFVQHGSLFLIRNRAHVFGSDTEFMSEPISYAAECMFGINSAGTAIAEYRLRSFVPIISSYKKVGNTWVLDAEPVVATINSFSKLEGVPAIEPGINDLRVFGSDFIVYFGRFSLPAEGSAKSAARWAKKPLLQMADATTADPTGYLFVTSLRTGDTRVIVRATLPSVRERVLPSVGRLSSSFDDAWLYVLGSKGIYRFSAQELSALLAQPE